MSCKFVLDLRLDHGKNPNQEIYPIMVLTWAHWVIGSNVIPDHNGGFTLNWFKYEEIEYKFLFMVKGGKS